MRLAYAMSEKWTWNGASGARTASASARTLGEGVLVQEAAVCDRVQVREVDDRAQPRRAPGQLEDVVGAAELTHAAHHLDAERNVAALSLEPLPQHRRLLRDRVERRLALPAQEKAGMEDDELGAARLRDSRRMVEHAHRPLRLGRVPVAEEGGDRGVNRERDACAPGALAELRRPLPVHPEAALEVDLARREAPIDERAHGGARAFTARYAGGPHAD